MAEGARLESVYTFIAYRGFESLSLRQIQKDHLLGGFFVSEGKERGDENPDSTKSSGTIWHCRRHRVAARAGARGNPSIEAKYL